MLIALRLLAISLMLSFTLPVYADDPLANQPVNEPVNQDAQTAWRLLDYIAVDYAVAVAAEGGEVVSEAEYAEMTEFSNAVSERLDALPPSDTRARLKDGAKALQLAIENKATPGEVASLARNLGGELLAAHPMPLAPSSAPDLARAADLYQQQCASCHGKTGAGDGPAGIALDPPAIDFTDESRARERSVFALYQVIEQGLEGTGMASYAHLPSEDRWALSFYIGQYAYPDELAAPGERLWNGDESLRARFPDLGTLTQVTPAALAQSIGEDDAKAVTAYLRRHPEVVQAKPEGSLALARSRLLESTRAYAAGDQRKARDLALSAYLDGFEPVEPLLAARDGALMVEIETAMAELRSRIGRSASVEDIQAQVEVVDGLFVRAEAALAPGMASNMTAFVGSFTILLREGLEALLVLIAMIAFLRKANRTEVMPYVHAGWVSALLAGGLTWVVATYLVSISGASRELTEGFAALFAAAVLLFVGIWMHGKSQAGAWQRYIKEKLSHALSKRSAWFLFLLSFVVVYREVFETVLFYAALWSQGNGNAILAGGAAGAVVLAGIAWAMLRYSRKLPISTFFSVSSILIAVLAVVLAGKGVAALQEAGWLSVSVVSFPRIALLGIYPTLQGVLAQLVTLAIIIIGFWGNRRAALAR
ncbi:FTR1 family protein [Lysobacter sp. A421]